MASVDWLSKAANNKAVIAWFNGLKTKYPEDIGNKDVKTFIKNDNSGYNYKAAVDQNMFPERDPVSGDLHWNDIGKTPKYWANTMKQLMTPAVRRQEGPPKYDPSRNIDTRTQTIRNSIRNNVGRWLNKYPDAMQPDSGAPDFVTFMANEGGPVGKGWAHQGVSNDPHNLNKNWIPGVKSIMKQNLGQGEYDYLHSQNLVMNNQQQTAPWLNTTSVSRQA